MEHFYGSRSDRCAGSSGEGSSSPSGTLRKTGTASAMAAAAVTATGPRPAPNHGPAVRPGQPAHRPRLVRAPGTLTSHTLGRTFAATRTPEPGPGRRRCRRTTRGKEGGGGGGGTGRGGAGEGLRCRRGGKAARLPAGRAAAEGTWGSARGPCLRQTGLLAPSRVFLTGCG